MIELSELQHDALGEIFNIGVGRAASSLSQIARDEVLLSAPEVLLVERGEAAELLLGTDFRHFSTVSQQFSGAFEANAMLIFPEANALEIVRLMVGRHMSVAELSEFEQEAMCEIGNIVLNACMGSLADLLHIRFDSTLPQHRFGTTQSLQLPGEGDTALVLILQVDMIISQQHIKGHMIFLLSVSSLSALIDCLNAYLSEQGLV